MLNCRTVGRRHTSALPEAYFVEIYANHTRSSGHVEHSNGGPNIIFHEPRHRFCHLTWSCVKSAHSLQA